MATTLIGIFDDHDKARAAAQELIKSGFKQSDVNITTNNAGTGYANYGGTDAAASTTGTSIGNKISSFFENLFGTDLDADERGLYAESVRRGSTLVVARAEDQLIDQAADIMNRYGAIDVDRRAAQYREQGYTNFDASAQPYTAEQIRQEREALAAQGEVALPVVEEQLQIGKRAVRRGGVRVYSRVTERPVEETVSLREEHVTVERRPVNRPVGDADRAAFKEGTFQVTEMAEEAVVAKQARVVEEVVVGKEVAERAETIRDTVRRTDVGVEQVDADVSAKSKGKSKGSNK